MKGALTVLRKECTDNFRDRRTLLSSFSMAVLGPLMFVALMSFVLNQALGNSDEELKLTVVGAQHAPSLMDHLRRQNTKLDEVALADPEQAVRNGDESLVLVIPDTYGADFDAGKRPSLALIYDSSDFGSARRKFSQARNMVSQHSRLVGMLRLQLRGISPAVVNPISLREVDTASPAARALTVLATLPYLLVLVVFMGGFYLAIDTTAGEREHGSLEPLLTQPIPRSELVLGKIGATSIFAAIALVLFITSFALALPMVPLHKVGMSLELGLLKSLAIIGVAIPLLLFAAALLTVVASFAKSYKEAQTYLTMVILVPTMPLIVTQLADVESSWWLMLIPSLSQSNLISDIIAGEPIATSYVVLSVLSTAVFALLLVALAVRLYRRERILG